MRLECLPVCVGSHGFVLRRYIRVSESLLSQIARCVEVGKCDADSKFPPAMAGQPGVDELVKQAMDE